MSDDGLTYHAETEIAANPRDPKNLLAACIAGKADGTAVIATYASFDGGRTWQSNGPLAGSEEGRDPTVTFTASGEGLVCANTGLVSAWRTSDGGRTFAPFVGLSATGGAAPPKTDHPWLSAAPGTEDLFAAWTVDGNTNLGFTRSHDAGRSFDPPKVIAAASGGILASPMVAAGSDGLVCVAYGAWSQSVITSTSKGSRGEVIAPLTVVCSTDGGATFAGPVTLGDAAMETPTPSGGNAISLATVAAGPGPRDLHVAFATRRPGADATVLVVRSSGDGGRTWSAPAPAIDERSGVFYFQPQVAVGSDGRLALLALKLDGGRVQAVLITRSSAGSFSAPLTLSSRSFDPAVGSLAGGSKHGAWWIGDYQGLTAVSGGFHAIWNDTRTGRLELFAAAIRV